MARFDAITAPHTHFRCLRCGNVCDLPLPYDGGLDRLAAGSGLDIKAHSLTFYGICPACAGKDNTAGDCGDSSPRRPQKTPAESGGAN